MTAYSLDGKRVWVAGHRGMVGSALVRQLHQRNIDVMTVDRGSLDLRDQTSVRQWLHRERPDAVFMAAARVGGILANATHPAEFLHDNLAIATSVIDAAWQVGVGKLLFLGSTCVYPKLAPQPLREDSLLSGPLEPTNEAYAIAKIAGLKLCEMYRRQYGADFISAMPTNLYGPNDNFESESGHALPALLRRIDEARLAGAQTVTVWGTGAPRREFMHVDDAADALIFLMEHYSGAPPVNVGTGRDIAISDLARLIAKVVGYAGALLFDTSKPDGTPRKLTDTTRLERLGWRSRISLEEGLRTTYAWYSTTGDTAKAAAASLERRIEN